MIWMFTTLPIRKKSKKWLGRRNKNDVEEAKKDHAC